MKFKFVSPVDAKLFGCTKQVWQGQLDANPENTSSSYYSATLDFLDRCVNGNAMCADGGGCVCAVVEDGNEFASALIVVTHARTVQASSFLTMMQMVVQPDLDLADREPSTGELAWLTAEAVVGCLGLTYEQYPCNQLKIRAAFPLDREFLTSIETLMIGKKGFTENFEVSAHGSWLVVTKKSAPVVSLTGLRDAAVSTT